MATKITDDCIGCGACVPECPNGAIAEGDVVYVIDAARCSECVGHSDELACAAVCPVDCCGVDPAEAEEALLARYRALHPERELPDAANLPASLSHLRKKAPAS